jgi:hypothetical protein
MNDATQAALQLLRNAGADPAYDPATGELSLQCHEGLTLPVAGLKQELPATVAAALPPGGALVLTASDRFPVVVLDYAAALNVLGLAQAGRPEHRLFLATHSPATQRALGAMDEASGLGDGGLPAVIPAAPPPRRAAAADRRW